MARHEVATGFATGRRGERGGDGENRMLPLRKPRPGTPRAGLARSEFGTPAVTKRAAIYLRAFTREQSAAAQQAELEAVGGRAGSEVVEIH
jgi:hypothetical protein